MNFSIIAATDTGSSKTFSSIKSAKLMIEKLHGTQMIQLLGSQCTKQNLVKEINKLKQELSVPHSTGYIYYTGHGNINGQQQYLQLQGGNLSSQELTEMLSGIDGTSCVILILDSCSSGNILKKNYNNNQNFQGNWICIASSGANEDSYQMGDGGYFTISLYNIWEKTMNKTLREIYQMLNQEVQNSNIGQMQHTTISVNSDQLWDRQNIFNIVQEQKQSTLFDLIQEQKQSTLFDLIQEQKQLP